MVCCFGVTAVTSFLVAGLQLLPAFEYGGEALLGFSFSVPEGAALGIQSVLGWSIAVAACVAISSLFKPAGTP